MIHLGIHSNKMLYNYTAFFNDVLMCSSCSRNFFDLNARDTPSTDFMWQQQLLMPFFPSFPLLLPVSPSPCFSPPPLFFKEVKEGKIKSRDLSLPPRKKNKILNTVLCSLFLFPERLLMMQVKDLPAEQELLTRESTGIKRNDEWMSKRRETG